METSAATPPPTGPAARGPTPKTHTNYLLDTCTPEGNSSTGPFPMGWRSVSG